MDKLKLFGGGGLGDAVILFCSLNSLPAEDYFFTHVEVPETLLPVINDFYETQKLNFTVQKIDTWDWVQKNKHLFDARIYTSINDTNDKIRFNPFPNYIYDDAESYDFLICPSSGRDNDRNVDLSQIKKFAEKNSDKKIAIIGKMENVEQFEGITATNLVNKLTIKQVVDLIGAGKNVIGNAGFITLLANSMGKKVFTIENRENIREDYFHKSWDNTFINNLENI